MSTLLKKKASIWYVVINLLVTSIGFLKSYFYMKHLGFYDVGVVALIQTTVTFISLLQFGMLNGGYFLFCKDDQEYNKRLNNFLHTFILFLLVFVLVYYFVHQFFVKKEQSSNALFMLIGCWSGVLTIAMNWVQNMMIAGRRLKALNQTNLISNVVSLCFIFFIPRYGLWPALLLIVTQPLIFLGIVYVRFPNLKPDSLYFNRSMLKNILTYGFIPFLCGICLQLNDQIERWFVINNLGIENLGKYNLVLIYSSLFTLVPTSLANIFVPAGIKAMEVRDMNKLRNVGKQFTSLIFIYVFATVVVTILFMPMLVQLLIPKYMVGVPYVWYILPGVCLLGLIAPINFLYYVSRELRFMLIAYLSAFMLSVLIVVALQFVKISPGGVTLERIATVKSGVLAYIAFVTIIFYRIVYKKVFKNETEIKTAVDY